MARMDRHWSSKPAFFFMWVRILLGVPIINIEYEKGTR